MTTLVNRLHRSVGRNTLQLYARATRARARVFSLACSGGFADFGRGSVIQPPARLAGERHITIGASVFIGAGSFLQVLEHLDGVGSIEVGDGVSVTRNCVLSSATGITLGRKVLMARNVYIADHRHAFGDPVAAIVDQGLEHLGPVSIGDGAWRWPNVVVGPGVTISRNTVMANSGRSR